MSRPDRRILVAIGVLVLSLIIGSVYRAGYLPGFRGEKGVDEGGRHNREGGEGEAGGRGAPVSVTAAPARLADVPVTIDEMLPKLNSSGMVSTSELISILFDLELEGLIRQLPGKAYQRVWH